MLISSNLLAGCAGVLAKISSLEFTYSEACFLFQSGACSKKSSDPPLPSYPGFLKLLSPRCSVLRAGLKSPGALQRHSRLPSAEAEPAPPYSSGAQPAWTSCATFLTCSPAESEGRAPAPTFPGSSGLLSFPGGNDLHTWPQRTEKNLTKEIPDLRGVRLGNTFLQLPGKHLPSAAGQCRSRDFVVRSTGPLSINQQTRKAFVYFKT